MRDENSVPQAKDVRNVLGIFAIPTLLVAGRYWYLRQYEDKYEEINTLSFKLKVPQTGSPEFDAHIPDSIDVNLDAIVFLIALLALWSSARSIARIIRYS